MIEVASDGSIPAFMLGSGLRQAEEPSLNWQTLSNDFGDIYLLHFAVDPKDPARQFASTHSERVAGHLRQHPPETAEDRRPGDDPGAAHQDRLRLSLPVSRHIRPRPCPPPGAAAKPLSHTRPEPIAPPRRIDARPP